MYNRKKHILVVDDDAQLLQCLEFILARRNFIVTTAGSGKEGVMKFHAARQHNHPVDLVISDLKMPVPEGLDLLDRIDGNIPKIVITTIGNKELYQEFLKRGCDHFIEKPFDEDELLSCIVNLLAIGSFNTRQD